MEFGLLMTDIPVYVSCKFEMYIFKIVLVISENVCIAFLYVLCIVLRAQPHPQFLKWYKTPSWLSGSHDNTLSI